MVIRYGAGKEGVEAEGTHVQVEGDWFVQLLDLHLHCEERLHCGEETLEHGWVQLEEDVLVQLVQQLVLHVPTSWPCLYVHVCEGGKALLCHLDVEGGDQLCQLVDEGGGEVCQLDVEGGGEVCKLGVEGDDDQLCCDWVGDGQAGETLPNLCAHVHCHTP